MCVCVCVRELLHIWCTCIRSSRDGQRDCCLFVMSYVSSLCVCVVMMCLGVSPDLQSSVRQLSRLREGKFVGQGVCVAIVSV